MPVGLLELGQGLPPRPELGHLPTQGEVQPRPRDPHVAVAPGESWSRGVQEQGPSRALGLPRGLAPAGHPSSAVLGAELCSRERGERAWRGCSGAQSWPRSLSLGQSHGRRVALGPQ